MRELHIMPFLILQLPPSFPSVSLPPRLVSSTPSLAPFLLTEEAEEEEEE